MAKGGSSPYSDQPPPPPLSVFIDTNLDTHLAMVVSPDDTVADLKGIIRIEHALCFPNIGEVSIQALKVKRRAFFYHLSDSMLVKSAFTGIKGTWFLQLDLEPTTSIVKAQAEAAGVIISETNGQPEKHNVHQSDHNANMLSDKPQDFVSNGMTIGKGLIQSITNTHESEALPDTLLQKLSAPGDSLLPDISGAQTQSLHVSSNGKLVSVGKSVNDSMLLNLAKNDLYHNFGLSPSELDRRLVLVPEMELVTESETAVGSNHQQKSGQVADKENKDRKGENHENVDVGDANVPVVATKKVKSRERSGALQNDQLLDGKSKHPYLEKNKRKKENDQLFKEPVKDQLTGHNLESSVYRKEMSQLEKDMAENTFQKKHESNLMPSEEFPSKPSHVDSSLQQMPVDDKQKKKKKKREYLSKSDQAPQDEPLDNSMNKTDATLGKQAAEENHVEGLLNNHTDMGKESNAADWNSKSLGKESNAADICKEAEQPSNHAKVYSEVPANSPCGRKKSKVEKDTSSKHEGNNDDSSGNSHDKLFKVSGVTMTDTAPGNENAIKSGIPLEICAESSHHSRKKKTKKTELPNTQYNTHETVKSSRDQVPEENQNKMSSTTQEHPCKKFKGAVIPGDAAAAGNSAVVESTFPSSPNDKKQKRRKKKSEKIEPHHQESNLHSSTYETLNSSRDQVIEECSKETSIRHLEGPRNESKGAVVLREAVENSTADQSIVPANPNDNKSKRRRKKSEKIELPSGESIRDESVHSLVDKLTKENPKESLEDDQNGLGSHLEHAGKGSEEVVLFGEATVVANLSTVDSTVPLSPSDKKSKRRKKKSGKTELPWKESSKDEASHPLVKAVTKESPGEMLDSSTTGIGKNSKSALTLGETADPASTVELGSVITSSTNGINSYHQEKKNGRSGLIDHSSSNFDIDYSLASDHTHENLEKVSGPTDKSLGLEFNDRISPDETGKNMDHVNPSNLDSSGFNDSSDKNEIEHLSARNSIGENTMGPQKAHEESDMGTVQNMTHKGSTKFIEAEVHSELPKSDSGKIDFFKFFDPKANQVEPAQELCSVETETKKTNKERTKRKKKLNPSPQDSTANLLKPSVSDKQCILQKKSQDNGSGQHSLGDPAVQIAKELLSSKKRKKKDANRRQIPDEHHPDTSYDVGSPGKSNDEDRPGKKIWDYESNTHFQASLSADDESKNPNRKNSMTNGSKLQSLTHNEDNEIMVSASEVTKHKDFDTSLRSSPGDASVTQNSPNAVANIPVEDDMAYLAPSSDSTEEDTPFIRKRYRVAVRKVPSNRYLKVPNKFNEEKTSLAASTTIFNDAISGSSEDEFEVSNKLTPVKATSDNSSTSADSDKGIEETQISYKNSPGAEAESTDCCKGDKGTNSARSNLTQSPKVKRKGKSLNMILRSTSSYKKAKLNASQSEFEDSESQPIDMVPETQPELCFL